jgi:3-oxoacyl-[acyl-carrier-protein] synthase-1
MAEPDVVIVSTGMMTAVGLSAAETAASVLAGTMRFGETPWRDHLGDPVTAAAVPTDGLPPVLEALAKEEVLAYREKRLLQLGTMPLRECLKPLGAPGIRPVLLLALPEAETPRPLDRPAFLRRLARQTGGVFEPGGEGTSFKGRAGGIKAIGQAAARIRAGQANFVLVGGIDTYLDLFLLATLDQEKRLKTVRHLDAFIPGEGAAFLLLASRKAAESARLAPLAAIGASAEGVEEGHLYSDKPYRGEGLAATVQRLQANGAKEPVQEVYASMNGENYWAKEWGVTVLRNASLFGPELGIHHPADCFGDTGAACGLLLTGLATLGMRQGYRRSPCLVYGSSDRGERAALVLQRAA